MDLSLRRRRRWSCLSTRFLLELEAAPSTFSLYVVFEDGVQPIWYSFLLFEMFSWLFSWVWMKWINIGCFHVFLDLQWFYRTWLLTYLLMLLPYILYSCLLRNKLLLRERENIYSDIDRSILYTHVFQFAGGQMNIKERNTWQSDNDKIFFFFFVTKMIMIRF